MARLYAYEAPRSIIWALFLAAVYCCLPYSHTAAIRDRDLIGWSEGVEVLANGAGRRDPSMPSETRKKGVEVLSWDSRIFIYRGLLTEGSLPAILEKRVHPIPIHFTILSFLFETPM